MIPVESSTFHENQVILLQFPQKRPTMRKINKNNFVKYTSFIWKVFWYGAYLKKHKK
jgi:hypothetical protein